MDKALPELVRTPYSDGQMKSYMRTPINYYLVQKLSANGFPSFVVGTGNRDDDRYLGYFCKAGDRVVDIQLISDLHKSDVYAVGKYLELHQSILNALPSADLLEDQTDEKEMGVSYDFVELYSGYIDCCMPVTRNHIYQTLSNQHLMNM